MRSSIRIKYEGSFLEAVFDQVAINEKKRLKNMSKIEIISKSKEELSEIDKNTIILNELRT